MLSRLNLRSLARIRPTLPSVPPDRPEPWRPPLVAAAATRAAAPMAIPLQPAAPSRASLTLAAGALLLATAGLWRQEAVVATARVALDGLRSHAVPAVAYDAADVPAMDPSLAWVLDPRARAGFGAARVRRAPVQPFSYVVQDGETLAEVAARFGTDVSALLWNNGLDSAEQVQAGARLTVLPLRGLLHLVKADESLAAIAARYGSRPEDVLAANALDRPEAIWPGQILVVAGGSVPMPMLVAEPPAELVGLISASAPVTESVAETTGPAAPERPVDEVLPDPPGAAAWQRDFILAIAPGARQSQRATGVPSSVTLAQAILESDWGRSKLTREANNLFGIKAFREGGTAGVYQINTWEVYGGQNVTVFAAFKAYRSLADSIADHGRWFHDNSRYHGALRVKDDPRAFAYAINAAGYATDPAYAPKLIQLMDRFNLYAYDVPAEP